MMNPAAIMSNLEGNKMLMGPQMRAIAGGAGGAGGAGNNRAIGYGGGAGG